MMSSGISWKDPVVIGIAGCFVIEAGLNVIGAYELLGGEAGGIKAKAIAVAGVFVAFLGAWIGRAAVPMFMAARTRSMAFGMMVIAIFCFGLSQMAAWRVMGMSFADGALRREVAGETLAALREERKKIGTSRAIGAIKADLDLELRKTSKTFPDGNGPVATKLRGELAVAERAAEIDTKIAEAGKKGQQVQAGSENMILGKVGLDQEQALLLVILLFTALIGFFANFGMAVLEFVRGGPPVIDGSRRQEMEPFRPELLPAPPRYAAIEHLDARRGDRTPQPPSPSPSAGGATNIINVGAAHGRLPARIAARRAGAG